MIDELIFVWTNHFKREWKNLGYVDSDKKMLEDILADNPEIGPVMRGTGGLRKMRFALSQDRGKSAGSRVCYYYQSINKWINLPY